MEKTIYHGSSECVGKPILGKGRPENDYGLGFYCTEDLDLAREWACFELRDGFANRYRLEMDGLQVLDLNDKNFTILHWLALLVSNRRINRMSPLMVVGANYIREHFPVDVSAADVIVGPRADDSYFQFARSFLSNTISVATLTQAMKLGGLGQQFVLKSEAAFERIVPDGWVSAPGDIYYPRRKARDLSARQLYSELEAKMFTLSDGIFLRDIVNEKMEADDARLQ